jgi:hypothetical protein
MASIQTCPIGLGVPTKYFVARLDVALVPLEVLGDHADVGDREVKGSLSLNVPLPFGSLGMAPQ